jgi:uncharacterized membrane protein YgcG
MVVPLRQPGAARKDLVTYAVVVFIDVIFVVAVFVFTVRVFVVGAPTVVFDVKFLSQVHQLFNLRVDQLRIQRGFAQDVAANDGSPSSTSSSSGSVTS